MRSSAKFLTLGLYVAGWLASAAPGTPPAGLPRVVAPLTEGTWTWAGKMNTGDQNADTVVTMEVKATADAWGHPSRCAVTGQG
jgi:hypothetical protein